MCVSPFLSVTPVYISCHAAIFYRKRCKIRSLSNLFGPQYVILFVEERHLSTHNVNWFVLNGQEAGPLSHSLVRVRFTHLCDVRRKVCLAAQGKRKDLEMKNNILARRIKNCLSCQIGHEVIRNYRWVYVAIEEKNNCEEGEARKAIEKRNLEKEKIREAIETLADLLELEGTLEDKFHTLERLRSEKKNDNFDGMEDNQCLADLQIILRATIGLFSKEKDARLDKRKHYEDVLSWMHEANEKFASSDNWKYNSKAMQRALKLLPKNEGEYDEEKMEKAIGYIFAAYCDKIDSKDLNDKGECFTFGREQFLQAVKNEVAKQKEINSKQKEVNDFFKRVDALCEDSKQIFLDYLQYAPKRFGHNLQCVMDRQKMTHQDIAQLMGQSASAIQSLASCDTPERGPEYIARLCKVLLVSQDVLYRGKGKRHGNWMDLLDEEGQEILQNKAQEFAGKKNKMKKYTRDGIKGLIDSPDEEFYQLIIPKIFSYGPEEYQTYEDEKECFASLLNKEDALALLEVLEARDKNHKLTEQEDKI